MNGGPSALHDEPPRTTTVRAPHDYLLKGLGGTARRIFRSRWPIEIEGEGNFPSSGPVVVAANHTGFADGPLMSIFAPRPLHALTKVEMFSGPMAPFLHQAGQIPLARGVTDSHAIRLALRVLRDGGAVGVFPEGTRGAGEMLHAQGGAAYLALVTGAPVVPLVFLGTRQPGANAGFPPVGTRIVMQYGEPLRLGRQPWPRRRDDVRRATEQVRTAVVALLDQAVARTGIATPGPIPPDRYPRPPRPETPQTKEHHD